MRNQLNTAHHDPPAMYLMHLPAVQSQMKRSMSTPAHQTNHHAHKEESQHGRRSLTPRLQHVSYNTSCGLLEDLQHSVVAAGDQLVPCRAVRHAPHLRRINSEHTVDITTPSHGPPREHETSKPTTTRQNTATKNALGRSSEHTFTRSSDRKGSPRQGSTIQASISTGSNTRTPHEKKSASCEDVANMTSKQKCLFDIHYCSERVYECSCASRPSSKWPKKRSASEAAAPLYKPGMWIR